MDEPSQSAKTNYAEIAERYDAERLRFHIPPDDVLATLADRLGRRVVAVDLGCGTGNYLKAQLETGPGDIEWHGIDPSPEMLDVAREKVTGVRLIEGTAEALPFENGSVDYLYTSFTFHHFEKAMALDEALRVLADGGMLRIVNISPERTPDWWPSYFFPEAAEIDRRRFWSERQMFAALEERGFQVDLRMEYRRHYQPKSRILSDALNRSMSQLAMLDDAAYERGLQRIRADSRKRVITEMVVVDIRAER